MGIKKRGKYWHYRVWIKGTEYTGTTSLDATERNRKAAQRFAEQKRCELEQGLKSPKCASVSFPEAAGQFLAWARDVEYRQKPNTAQRLATSFASLAAFFGDRLVREITAVAVEDYKSWRVREHQVRDVTIRHDLYALSLFFNRYAIKHEWAAANPVKDVKKPSDAESFHQHVVTQTEETAYFSKARGTLHDVGRLILLTGCRPEEILSLQPTNIDAEGAQLTIWGGKTRAARRSIDLTGEALEILKARLQPQGTWLFPSARIEGGHVSKLNAQHDRACLEAGVSFRLYDLRHTFATRMVEQGKCDIPTLAAILGHSSLRVLTRYVHPTAQHRKEAIKRMERAMKPKLKVVGK